LQLSLELVVAQIVNKFLVS